MLANMREILANRQTIAVIEEMVENWFNVNSVPLEHRMSVPLILLFQEEKIEEEGKVRVLFCAAYLYNQRVMVGNC